MSSKCFTGWLGYCGLRRLRNGRLGAVGCDATPGAAAKPPVRSSNLPADRR